jgi:plastocyanin
VRRDLILIASMATLALAACGGAAGTAAPTRGTVPSAATSRAPESVPPASGPSESQAPASAEPSEASEAAEVSIVDFEFSPATIEVAVGQEITWTNEGEMPHTATFTDGPDSGSLENGDDFSHAFEEPGTYDYICSFHPQMTGTVEVTE